MKTRNIWRFRRSLIPGLATAFGLLALVTAVLWQLLSASQTAPNVFSTIGGRDWQIVRYTTAQAALSTFLSILVGLLLAWALSHQRRFPGRALLVALLSTALVLPTLVVVFGLVTVLGRKGWLNDIANATFGADFGGFIYGIAGILVAHVYLNGSLAVRSLLNRLETIPLEKRKLARSLGLSSWQRFLLIEWPTIRSTIPGLASTIFLLCFTSFAIVLTLGGSPKFNTLEVAIYEAIKLDFDLPRAFDLALLQLGICAALVLVASSFKTNRVKISPKTNFDAWREPVGSFALQCTILTVLGAAFLFPLFAVISDGIQADFERIFAETTFRKALTSSLLIALCSSVLTLILSMSIAMAKRNFTLGHRLANAPTSGLFNSLLSFSGTLYLAVPSLVLGLGFFLIAQRFSGSLFVWAIIALLTANVLMALPFALAVLVPSVEKVATRYDRLSNSLALSGYARWRLVEWPNLRHDIGYVCAVAFCLSFGDLGVIALFGSQDFATLPWYLYQKMGSYRTDDAAGIALVMLALTIFVFLMLPKLFSRTPK